MRELVNWNDLSLSDITLEDLLNLKKDNVRIFCDVHGAYYECAGVPTQFYLYVLIVAVGLLVLFLLTTFFTLMYLLCPCGGELASFMRSYKSKLKSAAKMEGGETSSKDLLGELHEIYYENRDLRLMLDLLAKSSGLAPPLRVMAQLDKEFQKRCKPNILSVVRSQHVKQGESDITLEFSESDMVRDIFGKMDTLYCLYTAQITPRTDHDSLEIFVFERESESHLRIFSAIKVFNKSDDGPPGEEEKEKKRFVFKGADTDVSYTVRVTLVLNGKAIATSQKTVKSVQHKSQEDQENLIVDY